jgi:hypothetical protein
MLDRETVSIGNSSVSDIWADLIQLIQPADPGGARTPCTVGFRVAFLAHPSGPHFYDLVNPPRMA